MVPRAEDVGTARFQMVETMAKPGPPGSAMVPRAGEAGPARFRMVGTMVERGPPGSAMEGDMKRKDDPCERWSRWSIPASVALAAAVLLGPAPAFAQPASPSPPPAAGASGAPGAKKPGGAPGAKKPGGAPTPEQSAEEAAKAAKAEAKARADERYQNGTRLFGDGAYASALAEFVAASRLYRTWQPLTSAGTCLEQLQRYDEALDRFEAVMREFEEVMPPRAKTQAQERIIVMRRKTGTLTITGAEIGAIMVIDGRYRGEYPAPAPLNVLVGPHVVRVYKDGFEPFEASTEVAQGQAVTLAVPLVPLVKSGRLRVEESSGKALFVVVDGFPVGITPWEGPLGVGKHSVMLRGQEDFGTSLQPVTVRLNEKTEVTLPAEQLGASIKIAPDPAQATVFLDGFLVGRGTFDGRLRPGEHAIRVVADGYFTEVKKVDVKAGGEERLTVKLRRDPSSPRWAKPGRFTVEAGFGLALTPGFGGAIGATCTGACSQGVGIGGMLVFHGGYELGNRFGFGVQAGYLGMRQQTTDRATVITAVGRLHPDNDNNGNADSNGRASDVIKVNGFLAGVFGALRLDEWFPARLRPGERFSLRLRLGAGLALGSVSDTRTGKFSLSNPSLSAPGQDTYDIGPVTDEHIVPWFYMNPDLRAGLRLGSHVELSAGVSVPMFIGSAPTWDDREHGINAAADGWGTFGNEETLTSWFVYAIAPGLGVRYDF
jgi:hypothetical protein